MTKEDVSVTPTVVPVQKGMKSQSVIVFDWDDTLLSSSYLSSKGYRLKTKTPPLPELIPLEAAVIKVLNLAMKFGDVHILTNAETGWVERSCAKYLPGVAPLLAKVSICSARSTYEPHYPDDAFRWKFCAFSQVIQNVLAKYPDSEQHILSFGDSDVEREAVKTATSNLPLWKTKSVKFANKPGVDQLKLQLDLVANCFEYIHNYEGDLDLQLTIDAKKQDERDDFGKCSSSKSNSSYDQQKENNEFGSKSTNENVRSSDSEISTVSNNSYPSTHLIEPKEV